MNKVQRSMLYAMGDAARQTMMEEQIPPDIVINGDYLRRWYILRRRNELGCIYLHHFQRSDSDRALHDHPWPWTTIILQGSYREHTLNGMEIRHPGDVISRQAEDLHRIELLTPEVWTLFLTGAVERQWGFRLPDGTWLDAPTYFERFPEDGAQ